MKQLSFVDDHSSTSVRTWKLFIDGAARNNPGPAGAGIYLTKDDQVVVQQGYFLGSRTNNQAEYAALLLGLFFLKQKDIKPNDQVQIISDSELLIKQLRAEYRVRHPELQSLYRMAQQLLTGIRYKATHVLREDNVMADALANRGIDTKQKLPPEFIQLLQSYGISW